MADEVELMSGAKLQGVVKQIRANDREFDFVIKIGQRSVTRTYKFERVHAVTMKGRRHVLTAKNATSSGSPTKTKSSSPADIRKQIDAAAEPPSWFTSTKLDYPPTLDLDWPIKAPKGWNNRKNVGQYIWDIVNPNPGRWKPGIKLVHHCISLHKDDPELLQRDMKKLGVMYFELLQDYPRAAFWLEKAKTTISEHNGAMLAECYWRMGSKPMAMKMLNSKSLQLNAIKLLGAMGETQRALQLAQSAARSPQMAGQAYLMAADALRQVGKTSEAVTYYEKALKAKFRNPEYTRRYQQRARDSIESIRLRDKAQVARVVDGVHQGSAGGYNGPVQVAVEVADGKIQSVKVTKHIEKQFYSAITDTVRQIETSHSVEGIDATSRATITSQAIVNAAARALASGAR